MRVGDRARTVVALPGIPVGAIGTVKEVGRLFLAVSFPDGRTGYYAHWQLAPAASGAHPADAWAKMVDLGFSADQVPEGSHLCLLPETGQEALAVAARFLTAGLQAGEHCQCIAAPSWSAQLRRAIAGLDLGLDQALVQASLVFISPSECYLPPGEFTADGQLRRTEQAIRPHSGGKARTFSRPRRALVRQMPPGAWWEYERRATGLLQALGVMAMCAYDPGAAGSQQWQSAEASHPYVVKSGRLLPGGAASA